MWKNERGAVVLNLLAVCFSGFMATGVALTVMRVDKCEGRGYKTAQGEHRLACEGTGSCAGVCDPVDDTTSQPGVTITWCGCSASPGSAMSCAKVTTLCTPVLIKNAGGSVWLGCMNCGCSEAHPPTLNGQCAVTAIPTGSDGATDTCKCFPAP